MSHLLGVVSDERIRPRFRTCVILKAALGMFWARPGSLNALENAATSRFWREWLAGSVPSADTIGRAFVGTNPDDLRGSLRRVYSRLKRNKALPKFWGLTVAILDGHETHASYRRHCPGCLRRTIHTQDGDRVQYYHRNVTLMLIAGKLRLLLDVEAQHQGEDEVATAVRLLERALCSYPRAFQVILADVLYAKAPFVNFLWTHRKHFVTVLKDERRDIYEDSRALFELQPGQPGRYRNRTCLWWDVSELTSWTQVELPLRAVRSLETYTIRRQDTKEPSQETTTWIWLTNLPSSLVSTAGIVHLGHARWDIENYGFNELVNDWHADHIYRHDPGAIEALYLTVFLAFNLFHAFLTLNVKPTLRHGKTDAFWIRVITSEIYSRTSEFSQVRSP